MCRGLIHRLLPGNKILRGVIAMDIDGPKLYQYRLLGKKGLKRLRRTGSIICRFRGGKDKLIRKIKRMRLFYHLPEQPALNRAA
ncbi:MAG: hypothetical protein A3J76_05740 [Candidatus Moranbacteria bacterium RBG_13_45_13]|nr:MAG: hypothetical protein A3J76_05740 [Candidatus Moranbacteria bacterium RBG_13_45_13]